MANHTVTTAPSQPLRQSIRDPIAAIFRGCDLLSSAAQAHLLGDRAVADALFREANLPDMWNWINPGWSRPDLNVRVPDPADDTHAVPERERDPVRNLRRQINAAVLARDGYRCRYCGIPVVDAGIRKIVHGLYPAAVPWHPKDVRKQHAAFQCLWLQFDHVVPHSHGGLSSECNVVVSCGLCNFGKDKYTLNQLGISDPRLRPPEPIAWDGLERLRGSALPRPRRTLTSVQAATEKPAPSTAFFIPGAWVQGGYVYTPPIAGKWRWFKISKELAAESVERAGMKGCRLLCDPTVLQRRGLSPAEFMDAEQTPT